ncbi:MAG: T9SS type A sorting domain-containing protein [Bacteroidota bacterium]
MLRFGFNTARFASIHVLLWIALSVHFFVTVSDASAQAPSVSATPRLLDFGPVATGEQQTLTVSLANDGEAPLSGTISLDADAVFSLTGVGAFNLEPGASLPVDVAYTPTGAEQVAGAIVIEAADEALRVPLYGGALYHPAARGARAAEATTVLRGNAFDLSVTNGGFLGDTYPFEVAGGDDVYVGIGAFAVMAEIEDESGNRRPATVAPRGPGQFGSQYEPSNPDNLWTLEPVPGFASELGEVAVSTDATTWPAQWPDRRADAADPGWPGAWNGFLGKDAYIGGMETFSVVADNYVDEYAYTPDAADPARRGLGLVIEQRTLAWRHPALSHTVFMVYDVWNASPRDLPTVRFLFRHQSVMGGDGDTGDDAAWYERDYHTVTTFDLDNSGNQRQPAPPLTTTVLESPTSQTTGLPVGLSAVFAHAPFGAAPFSNDVALWQVTTLGAFTEVEWLVRFIEGGGVDLGTLLASGDFALPAYERERFVLAWVVSPSEQFPGMSPWIAEPAVLARSFQRSGYAIAETVSVQAPSLLSDEAGLYEVTWTPPDGMDRVHLAYTADFGQTWTDIAWGLPNSGTATWDASSLDQGIYQIQVTAYSDDAVASGRSASLRLDGEENAPPVVAFATPLPSRLEGEVAATWTADDPEGETVTVALDYALDGAADAPTWFPLAEGLPASGTYSWDTAVLPNGTAYQLRVRAQAGEDGVEARTRLLTVANTRRELAEDARGDYEGIGTPMVTVQVVDEAALTSHRYRVDFSVIGPLDNELTTYDIVDEDVGTTVVTNAALSGPNTEGPLFDGMRLLIANPIATPDLTASGFDTPSAADSLTVALNDLFDAFTGTRLEALPMPLDYEIVFTESAVSMSTELDLGLQTYASVPARFEVRNTTDDEPVPFLFIDLNDSGTLDRRSESIVLLADVEGELRPTYQLYQSYLYDEPPVPPGPGDRYRLITRKPIRDGDTFRFEARVAVDAEGEAVPTVFALHSAYPNPFTAATTLTFDLDRAQEARLVVFDVLGREVRVLADGAHAPGRHTVQVDGAGLGSGVYFVRLEGEGQQATRKLLRVR